MLPPNSDCNPPKKLPTIERERTVMPRTIPRFLVTVCPGNENAPVIIDRCIRLSLRWVDASRAREGGQRARSPVSAQSAAGLEQFYRVAGRVLDKNLTSAGAGDDFTAKTHAG